VDGSRGHDHFASIDGVLSCGLAQITDRCDFAVADSDISRIPRRASAVDDVTVCNDEVKRRRGLFREGQAARQKKDKSNHCEEKIQTTFHWFGLSFYLLCGSNGKCPFRQPRPIPINPQTANASHSYPLKWPGIAGTIFINI